ncbi:plasmid mobilization relaxosome protein MobC [Carnobacterium maltaromaticum]|uniref:plasmid mobilization protein n=1 Tax=Carnobacterium TaxID=2747 RepID=UPI00242EEBA2|nr:plasmid mobilization relaxosome protein MobC [Carnobacterium maltaromaticum]MCI1820500.1 MobC family plasmid mobilization relaxosome protein [Carnobacterium maltaromaticum]
MVERERDVQKNIRLSKNEYLQIQRKMELANTTNFSSYSRRMLTEGLVIHKDFSDLKELIKQLSMIGNNINQIAKKLNGTGSFTRDDMNMMNQNYIRLTKEINRGLLKIIYEDRRGI